MRCIGATAMTTTMTTRYRYSVLMSSVVRLFGPTTEFEILPGTVKKKALDLLRLNST